MSKRFIFKKTEQVSSNIEIIVDDNVNEEEAKALAAAGQWTETERIPDGHIYQVAFEQIRPALPPPAEEAPAAPVAEAPAEAPVVEEAPATEEAPAEEERRRGRRFS